ncbi:MAG: 50S ribosomal protein L1 [Candidatus Woesebacteria bacterium]|jgi:large subunit ribosomal protein L1
MGSKKNVDMSSSNTKVKIVKASEEKKVEKKKVIKKKIRSKKYQATRSQIDKSKAYDLATAVELVKKLSYSKFDGTITAALVVKKPGEKAELNFPHATGQTVKVAIVSPAVLKKINDNQIDFDVLLATPQDMPKITKFAKILGPKGLMPNPKNGTLTPNPELKKKELAAGKMTIKTEKKAPLMHVTVGKVSMDSKALLENVQALIKALKGKISKMSLAASMSPSVKVAIE